MTFDDLNLNKPLLQALEALGYTTPTTIQHKVFSVVMSGRDVCGIAQTGTGKTFAYLLPCLRQWKFSKERFAQILIIVPTRELVVQVVEDVKKLTSYMTLEVVGVYGGVNMKPQIEAVENGLDVLVATPGRLLDLMLSGSFKTKAIKKLVVDEVDEMLNLGFRPQLKRILDMLPAKRQNLLFSATMIDEVEQLMGSYFQNPEKIEAAPTGTPLENIQQVGYRVPNFYTKLNLLKHLLAEDSSMGRVLLFAATKKLSDELFEELKASFPDRIGVIHSNKSQPHRFNAVNQFQAGNFNILIATDVIARGLDIADVSHVINFDTPDEPESYIHRIGRTGRADKSGRAIVFISDLETQQQQAIEALMNYEIPLLPIPKQVEISKELTDEEKPKVFMKIIEVKTKKPEQGGGAFHEKSEKNKKVNVKIRHADKMRAKYGKPKTRGGKK